MKAAPSNTDNPVNAEMLEALEEARALRAEVHAELDRIRVKIGRGGLRVRSRLFYEVFLPEGIDRATLRNCIVYHGLIGSSPPWEKNLPIDLPGDQNLMALTRRKLEELKQM